MVASWSISEEKYRQKKTQISAEFLNKISSEKSYKFQPNFCYKIDSNVGERLRFGSLEMASVQLSCSLNPDFGNCSWIW
jgi:hypothetical protein